MHRSRRRLLLVEGPAGRGPPGGGGVAGPRRPRLPVAPLNEPPPAPPQRALVEQIAERGAQLRSRIAELTDRDVAVVCVTKGHPVEVAAAAVAAGFTRLGENYAQELRDKAAALIGPTPEWHFIGRLQTNKVRLVDRVVSLWQSVDRAALADRIAQRVPGAAVLVQVDLAGLAGRGGCPPEDVPALVEHCRGRGLDVRGLMGVGPPGPGSVCSPRSRTTSDSRSGRWGCPTTSTSPSRRGRPWCAWGPPWWVPVPRVEPVDLRPGSRSRSRGSQPHRASVPPGLTPLHSAAEERGCRTS
ncbi:MAG: hypothetical protein EKK62_09685 [Acidimicrobiia bacterium]|nr:MAG: hypothetical protein EKK62_09685 [Acidimicrobiia bacterium]